MRKVVYILCGALLLGASCTESSKETENQNTSNTVVYDTAQSGLIFRKLKEGKGRQIKDNEIGIVHLAGYLRDGDKEFVNTWKYSSPMHVHLGAGQVVDGLNEGILKMHVGDSYEFIVPPNLGYGEVRMLGIPAHSKLTYQVQLLGIKDASEIVFDTTGIEPEITGSGLEIYWIEKTDGNRIEPGQTVKVHYSGCLINGRKFDSSYDRGTPIVVTVAKRQVIAGWDEVLQLMKPGEKVKVKIPYHLAYGEYGKKGYIPPKSDLVFDIELLELLGK